MHHARLLPFRCRGGGAAATRAGAARRLQAALGPLPPHARVRHRQHRLRTRPLLAREGAHPRPILLRLRGLTSRWRRQPEAFRRGDSDPVGATLLPPNPSTVNSDVLLKTLVLKTDRCSNALPSVPQVLLLTLQQYDPGPAPDPPTAHSRFYSQPTSRRSGQEMVAKDMDAIVLAISSSTSMAPARCSTNCVQVEVDAAADVVASNFKSKASVEFSMQILELTPSVQKLPTGDQFEALLLCPCRDLYMNLPALKKLDTMLLPMLGVYAGSKLSKLYADDGLHSDVRAMFDEMAEQDCTLWNMMMDNCIEVGDIYGAVEMLRHLKAPGCRPNILILACFLLLCTIHGEVPIRVQHHSLAENCGKEPEVAHMTMLFSEEFFCQLEPLSKKLCSEATDAQYRAEMRLLAANQEINQRVDDALGGLLFVEAFTEQGMVISVWFTRAMGPWYFKT